LGLKNPAKRGVKPKTSHLAKFLSHPEKHLIIFLLNCQLSNNNSITEKEIDKVFKQILKG